MLQHHSLYRCSTSSSKLLLTLASRTVRRTISAGVSPGINRDAAVNGPTHTRLQRELVPAIRNALFQDSSPPRQLGVPASDEGIRAKLRKVKARQALLGFIKANLDSHEDGLRLCSVFPELVKTLNRCWNSSTSIDVLHDVNAIVTRLELVGVTLPRQVLRLCMVEAARRGSPAAVMAYITKMRYRRQRDRSLRLPVKSVLIAFANQQDPLQRPLPWSDEHERQEWLRVMEVLLSEWDQHEMEGENGKAISDYHSINLIFNKFIQAFHFLDDYKRAWDVAKGYEPRFGPINSSNWELLLRNADYSEDWLLARIRQYEDQFRALKQTTSNILFSHPELIKNWTPDLYEPLKVELERQLEEIERALGFYWQGGEDGFHKRMK